VASRSGVTRRPTGVGTGEHARQPLPGMDHAPELTDAGWLGEERLGPKLRARGGTLWIAGRWGRRRLASRGADRRRPSRLIALAGRCDVEQLEDGGEGLE
jgi:hypothetical protein